ncbi:hypothetical protein HMSSN036_32370 [Paenibacillus macerans]|nr:hypothetical protein HMSSN036_32370 [Paenibacillus macerans]
MLLFTVVLGVFALRMAWIQAASAFRAATVGGKTINELAVRQREESIELDPGRGNFLDRNGLPLTGRVAWSPILFPVKDVPDGEALRKLAALLKVTPAEFGQCGPDCGNLMFGFGEGGETATTDRSAGKPVAPA